MSKRSQIENNKASEVPFAKFAGVLPLGGRELDVYVLSNEDRVLSMRGMVRTMAEVDHGRVGKIPGANVVLPLAFNNSAVGTFCLHGNFSWRLFGLEYSKSRLHKGFSRGEFCTVPR